MVERRIENTRDKYRVVKELIKGNCPITFERELVDMSILPFLTYGQASVVSARK